MNTQTDMMEGIKALTQNPFFDKEKEQLRDQVELLEREVERQEIIIDALIKAIKVIERG